MRRLGRDLRAIIATNVLRLAPTADHDLLQTVNDSPCRGAAGGFEQQAFPGVFVDDRQDAHGAAIGRAVLDEVVAPDLIRTAGAATQGQPGPQPAAFDAMASEAMSPLCLLIRAAHLWLTISAYL